MKVLHIETGRHLYGGALQVFYLLRGLHAAGNRNFLACVRGSEIGKRAANFADIHELTMAGDVDPRFFLELVGLIRQIQPDVVHVHSRRGADWWGGMAARWCGVRAIVTRRVDNPESPWLARIKYRFYDRIVTISDGIRRVLLAQGIPAERIELIHSVVDRAQYDLPPERQWFAEEFDLLPEELTVAVIAQLIDRKGHRFLIEAAPAILEVFPKTRFIFFGKGPLREELAALCHARGIQERVVFAGFRDDLHRILPNIDLVVHPALMEGLGVSLLQAAAAGVPIVGAEAGGIPEVVKDGVNGFLTPPGEVTQLQQRVIELLRDPPLRSQMGEQGKSLVAAEFSIESMVNRYRVLYSSLVG